MPWKPKPKKWNWRAHLTADESAVVRILERSIAKHRKEVKADAAELGPIRNRAIQRAKYEAEKG